MKIWAKIIQRLRSYPNTNNHTQVNTFMDSGKVYLIKGQMLLKQRRRATTAISKDKLGFTASEIGLHSARSGAAMALYLAGIPVYTIMLIGRWSSDAFLLYIRKQVQEFSRNISNKMISNENFFTIPEASREDPRTRNHKVTYTRTYAHTRTLLNRTTRRTEDWFGTVSVRYPEPTEPVRVDRTRIASLRRQYVRTECQPFPITMSTERCAQYVVPEY